MALCTMVVMADPIPAKLGSFLKMDSKMDSSFDSWNSNTFTATRDQELSKIEQDPCAGCFDAHVVRYQTCMSTLSNNPCTLQYTGVAFDNDCCVTAQKHSMCGRCNAMGAAPHYGSKWTDQVNL